MYFPFLSFLSILMAFASIDKTAQTPKPVAVVELFTSEGCSICPPADKLLSRISDTTNGANRNIIALSFHVHYWDRLGWSDPYSDRRYSDRQRLYSKTLGINRVYTPQMIVNGSQAFVGSDEKEVEKALQRNRLEALPIEVSIDKPEIVGNQCKFRYHVSGASKNLVINLALTEDDLIQKVTDGENRGKSLKHDNVVRVFRTEPLTKRSAEVSLRIPEGVKAPRMKVVVFVQDKESLEVLGAAFKKAT